MKHLATLAALTAVLACGKTPVDPGNNGSPTAPSARGHASIVYDAPRQRVLLYGGVNNNSTVLLDELWSWDGSAWSRVAAATGGRPIGTVLYGTSTDVFSVTPTGLVARLIGTSWVQVSAATMPERIVSNFAYDTTRGRLVRYGGGDGNIAHGETWEFDGQTWTLITTEGPSARRQPAMAYDSRRGVTVLFGGQNMANQNLSDTWEWNGTTWTEVSAGGPAPRFGATMVFDDGAGEMLLFGGRNTIHLSDTWRRSGGSWMQAAASGPSARTEANIAYDAARRNIVLYGGDAANGFWQGDTWTWNGQTWGAR